MLSLNQKGKVGEPARNLWCAFYPFCLDVHVWHSKRKFTCIGCARYRPIHLDAETAVEDGISCGHFLHALFFGVDYEVTTLKKKEDQESVVVPVRLLRGLLYSFSMGMTYLKSTSNIAAQLESILKQEKDNGQCTRNLEGDTEADADPGAEGGDPGESIG